MTREEILDEIRRMAAENGGKPLGRNRFLRVTGLTEWEFGQHWARYGDAVREAGFEPNRLQPAYDEAFLLGKFIGLTRELGRIPTRGEMRLQRINADPAFPHTTVFDRRFGSKNGLIGRALDWCRDDTGCADVVPIFENAYKPVEASDGDDRSTEDVESTYGFVYLIRGHVGEYKIGRTNLVDRRVAELGATSSVEQTLIHEIKTDDPVGIENYWHARFADKRMRGEWFRLDAADIRAFKRWKRTF